MNYEPVCGSDNKVYSNTCMAGAAGVESDCELDMVDEPLSGEDCKCRAVVEDDNPIMVVEGELGLELMIPQEEEGGTPTWHPTAQPTPMPSTSPTDKPTVKSQSIALQPDQRACITVEECDSKRKDLGFTRFSPSLSYTTKGCFFKRDKAYFGIGGSGEDLETTPLQGQKQRIWCDRDQANSLSIGDTCVDIKLRTDKYGQETALNFVRVQDSEVLLDYPVGSLESETTYSKRICAERGKYKLTVYDNTAGICCSYGRGRYSLSKSGFEVVYGGQFRDAKASHIVLLGYDPELSDQDSKWLEAHNRRRQMFHELHGEQFRPLHWSPSLAEDASRWADKLLETCKITREPNLQDGENISVKSYGGGVNAAAAKESPDSILIRWADSKMKNDNPLTLSQVMWRSSRYLGCSDKRKTKADGTTCYVHVCRYIRPGNCNLMGYESWLDGALDDQTSCGRLCPEEGCH